MEKTLVVSFERLPPQKHSITKHSIEIHPYIILGKKNSPLANILQWTPEKTVENLLVASALSKVWKNYKSLEMGQAVRKSVLGGNQLGI